MPTLELGLSSNPVLVLMSCAVFGKSTNIIEFQLPLLKVGE